MPRLGEVLERQLQDPEMREYWERTALARAVANAVIRYRIDHSLSQRALAGLEALPGRPPGTGRAQPGHGDARPSGAATRAAIPARGRANGQGPSAP